MRYEADQLYHLYNRGNNQQQLFFAPAHYLYFLKKIRAHVLPHCHILAYCLMPNHFHLLVYTTATGTNEKATPSSSRQPLAHGIAAALSSYAQGLNKELGNSGAVFQAKTKARQLLGADHDYPRTCFHYIHQNPVRAGLTQRLDAWPYASYQDYAGLRAGTLCNQELARELLDLPADPVTFKRESEQAINPDRMRAWL